MKKIFAAVSLVLMLAAGTAIASSHWDGKSIYIREEAERRGMTLIGEARVREIASRQLGGNNIYIKEIELRNEVKDYPDGSNFRPVYKLECMSGYEEYELEIDAVTGKLLKYELDD